MTMNQMNSVEFESYGYALYEDYKSDVREIRQWIFYYENGKSKGVNPMVYHALVGVIKLLEEMDLAYDEWMNEKCNWID